MTMYSKIFLSLMFVAAVFISPMEAAAQQPETFYKYGHNDAEYSVLLPEAPVVETIWADDPKHPVPYLDNPPKEGAIGEVASFRRVDLTSEDTFEARITFIKADRMFLDSLTMEKMKAALANDFSGTPLTQAKFDYSASKDNTLKWATVTGFSVDRSSRPYYNAEHYLTGLKSIMVVRVRYSVENKIFEDYFKHLTENITYQTP